MPNLHRGEIEAEIGGVRRNLAGEFAADWPWVLHMSLLGDSIRVPEQLVTKIFRPRSLSRSWRQSTWQFTAVTLSASLVYMPVFWHTARAEDIDLFVANTAGSPNPNILVILDNSANWSSAWVRPRRASCRHRRGQSWRSCSTTWT